MHGVVRQEIVFADHLAASGRPPRWLSVPLVLTSHTWENGKNEQSHQDPVLAESLLGSRPTSRGIVPAGPQHDGGGDAAVYQTHGQIWTLVVPKSSGIADLFTPEEGAELLREGALRLEWAGLRPADARVLLTAVGRTSSTTCCAPPRGSPSAESRTR